MINVQTTEITVIKDDFFAIMEEICVEDMDDQALLEYQQRHQESNKEEEQQ